MSKIIDLDILRPEPKRVKLNGNVIDVSFIPTGATFDVDEIVRELTEAAKLPGKEAEKKAFDLTLRLCVVFCEHKHPDMDEAWFRENTSPQQIKVLAEAITEALMSSYAGVEAYSKN